MFEKLINRIRNGKVEKVVPQELQQETKKEDDSKVILTKNDDVLKMTIIGTPSLHTFFEKANELPEGDRKIVLQLPLGILANSNQQVNPGNYMWTTIEDRKYIILSNKESININQTKKVDDIFEERSLTIDLDTNTFTVYKAIHDSNYSTMEHKKFDCTNYGIEPSDFELSPIEAKKEYEVLFDDLMHEEKVLSELNGVFDVGNTKAMLDNYFSYIIANYQAKSGGK